MRALFDDRIQQMQRELEAVTTELQAKVAIANAVPALRDEIDLLRPMAERVGKMDGKLAKYKAKIEELAGLNGKLRVCWYAVVLLDGVDAHPIPLLQYGTSQSSEPTKS